ncbi:hypothetical protein RB200_19630 [Streptomyces sp. PmtG]
MTRHRRYALACRAGAALLAAGAAYTGHHHEALPTLGLVYGAVVLAWCGQREAAVDRRDRVDAQRAALGARPVPPPPLAPCCLLWTMSDGGDHGADCLLGPALVADIHRGWQDLDAACCLASWESRGATHDGAHCTRKDQAA